MPRDLAARLIVALEANSAGDHGLVGDVLLDLVDEVEPVRPSSACPVCRIALWPGQVAAHASNVHHLDIRDLPEAT